MRKAFIALTSCIAVVALAAFSTPAFGVTKVDPRCDLNNPEWGEPPPGPYDNDPEIHEFRIEYTSKVEHRVAGYTAEGLACGTQISGPPASGQGTFYNNAKVRQAPGEVTNSTAAMDETSYVGDGYVLAASHVAGFPTLITQRFVLRTAAISECEVENGNLVGGPEPGEIVACYRGESPGLVIHGHNYNFVVEQGARDVTVIGPFYNDTTGAPAGLTSVGDVTDDVLEGFTLCAYAGDTGPPGDAGYCGNDPDRPGGTDYSKPVRRNGDYSVCEDWVSDLGASCKRGGDFGELRVTATRVDGVTTPEFPLWTRWQPDCSPAKGSAGMATFQEWKPGCGQIPLR